MAVDVREPESPGWWMKRLGDQLARRRKRLQLLDDWYKGRPPVTSSDPNYEKYRDVVRQSQTNFASLAVDSKRERMRQRAIRTSVDSDLRGDERAWQLWRASNLQVESATCHRYMLALGVGYVIVGVPEDGGEPLATVEDPREVITLEDPRRPGEVLAALKLMHDDVEDLDLAYLWLPGELHVATRPRRATPATAERPVLFSPAAFTIDDDQHETWDPELGVPVVPFETEDGEGTFEKHLGLLERIDRGTFRRDTIALLQAFRQRGLIGDLDDADVEDDREPGEDQPGGDVVAAPRPDLDDVLSADPGALWQLPEGVKLWESGQVDLTPLQTSKRDDVKEFAAVTRTPLSMITPDAAAQSAEGASLQREGLVYSVEDLRERAGGSWARVTSLLLRMAGEEERGKLDGIVIEWMPAERFSLGERGNAATAAKASGVPWRTRMTDIWNFDPEKVARMEDERLEDLLYELGAGQPGSQPAPAPAGGAGA